MRVSSFAQNHRLSQRKIGAFLILNTDFLDSISKRLKNARFRVKIAYFRDRQTTLLFREKYSRWDICFSHAEGVTRYVESVFRSRLAASPPLDKTQLASVCKHPRRAWSVALCLSYSRVRQTTLSTCPVIGNKSTVDTSPTE